jgi:hypothetical protein
MITPISPKTAAATPPTVTRDQGPEETCKPRCAPVNKARGRHRLGVAEEEVRRGAELHEDARRRGRVADLGPRHHAGRGVVDLQIPGQLSEDIAGDVDAGPRLEAGLAGQEGAVAGGAGRALGGEAEAEQMGQVADADRDRSAGPDARRRRPGRQRQLVGGEGGARGVDPVAERDPGGGGADGRDVAPSARRIANSCTRWAIVTENVLKITSAPTNTAMSPNASSPAVSRRSALLRR